MKPSTLSNSFLYLVFALICISSIGCGPNFGEKLEIEGTEIYYKDGATQADAQKLGDKLKELQFVDGNRKSVQLLKPDDVWEFRMAVGKSGNSEAIRNQMKRYCLELSSAFDGAPVEVHICNSGLESKSVVKGLSGKRYQYTYKNSSTVCFYQDIDIAKVKRFVAIAKGSELDRGDDSTFHISKSADAIEIRMAHSVEAQKNKAVMVAATNAAVSASNTLFGGKRVDVLICDPYFDSPKVFSSVKKAKPAAP